MTILGRSLVLFACFVGAAGIIARASEAETVQIRESLDRFPTRLGDWNGVQQAPFAKDILAVLGVDDYLTRVYYGPDRAGVGLYIGYYQSQRQGDTMHSPLNCLPGAGWEPLSKGVLRMNVQYGPGRAAREIEINRYVIQKGLDRQLVLYWYQAHGRIVASEYWGKFYLVADAMRLNRTDGALLRVTSPFSGTEGSEARAESVAVSFVEAMFPHLSNFLPE